MLKQIKGKSRQSSGCQECQSGRRSINRRFRCHRKAASREPDSIVDLSTSDSQHSVTSTTDSTKTCTSPAHHQTPPRQDAHQKVLKIKESATSKDTSDLGHSGLRPTTSSSTVVYDRGGASPAMPATSPKHARFHMVHTSSKERLSKCQHTWQIDWPVSPSCFPRGSETLRAERAAVILLQRSLPTASK